MAVLYEWEQVVSSMKSRPEVAGVDQLSQDLVAIEISVRVNPENFHSSDAALICQIALACHVVEMQFQDSAGEGSLSSESIGGISKGRTMAVNNALTDENIRATTYGRRYIDELLPLFLPRGKVG